MKFIWDEEKNIINIEKHNISFEKATEAWSDPLSFDLYDNNHSLINEDRWFRFGKLISGEIIRVVYIEISDDLSRIITAYSSKTIERIYNEENN